MRWFRLGALTTLFVLACSPPQVEQQRLKDGSWKLTCQLPMDDCVREARPLCARERYRILEGTSATRLRDAPPFETAYYTSQLRIACSNDGADVLLSAESAAPDASAASSSSCSRGATRACVGPGACQGGQACLPDGSGFGPCDCGPASAAVDTPPAPAPPPSAAPEPTEPAPSTPPVASPKGGSEPTAP